VSDVFGAARSSGSRRASSTWAKTLPGTESREIGLWLLHSVRGPLPSYSETMMPSLQSACTIPVFQTRWNIFKSGSTTESTAHFRSSGGRPSAPGARPFFNFRMARLTSSRCGCVDRDVSVWLGGRRRHQVQD